MSGEFGKFKITPENNLTGKEFVNLTVKGFNLEQSMKLNRKCWNCECKLCGSIKHIQERLLLAGKTDCGCQKYVKSSENKRKVFLEKAKLEVGKMHGISRVDSINESLTNSSGTVIFNMKCGRCGAKYTLQATEYHRGRGKLCSKCSYEKQCGINNPDFKNYTGEEVGGKYKVLHLNDKDNFNYSWECENILTGEHIDLTSRQLYKVEYDIRRKESRKKVPFTFVNKDQ